MKNIDFKFVGIVALKVLWRVALVLAAIAIVATVSLDLVLKTIFSGPSDSARAALTLSLLESDAHKDIPVKYLGQEAVDAIVAANTGSMGTGNPSFVHISGEDSTDTEVTVEGDTFTAVVSLFRDPAKINVTQSGNRYLCITDGVLQLSDTDDLGGHCRQILILDGKCNEALLGGNYGYAPYIALGQTQDGQFILITTDGWTTEHPGATYRDLINMMTQYGAVNACVVGISEE